MDAKSALGPQQPVSDPFAPIIFNRPSRLRPPFKAVVFNAYGCASPEAVARRMRQPPLRDASILLLSEADWGLRRSGGRHTAAELARLLEMSFVFCPEFAFRREDTEFTAFFGNAILSAAPLENIRFVRLEMFYDWTRRRKWKTFPGTIKLGQRGGVAAEINLGGRAVTVGLAHLENRVGPQGRARQLAQFVAALPPWGPAVIGGDFNTTTVNLRDWRECAAALARMALEPRRLRAPQPHEPLFEELQRAGFDHRTANAPLVPTFTPSGLIPRFMRAKLDWIALRGLNAVPGSARVAPARRGLRRFSDHDFVVCEFV